MATFKIVNTDNFGSDYPNEKFVENLPVFYAKQKAEDVCKIINESIRSAGSYPRYFKVVDSDYRLKEGFEP